MGENFQDKAYLPEKFGEASRKTARNVVELDAYVVDWLKEQFGKGWQSEINGLLRFYMDTNGMTPDDAEPDGGPHQRWEI